MDDYNKSNDSSFEKRDISKEKFLLKSKYERQDSLYKKQS